MLSEILGISNFEQKVAGRSNLIQQGGELAYLTVFVGSYFFRAPGDSASGSNERCHLWIVYGLLIGAAPVIAANALVFMAAAWTLVRSRPSRGAPLNS